MHVFAAIIVAVAAVSVYLNQELISYRYSIVLLLLLVFLVFFSSCWGVAL